MDHRFNLFSSIYAFISNNARRIVVFGMIPAFIALTVAANRIDAASNNAPYYNAEGYVETLANHNVDATILATTTTVPPTTTTAAPTTTTTTIPDQIQGFDVNNYHCPELYEVAMSVGWEQKQWPKLSHIIHRESRCNPGAWNRADPGTGSRGLTQINSFWCSVNKNNPTGFLQAAGVLNTCDDLFRPRVSLKASLVIWNRSGWSPWGG